MKHDTSKPTKQQVKWAEQAAARIRNNHEITTTDEVENFIHQSDDATFHLWMKIEHAQWLRLGSSDDIESDEDDRNHDKAAEFTGELIAFKWRTQRDAQLPNQYQQEQAQLAAKRLIKLGMTPDQIEDAETDDLEVYEKVDNLTSDLYFQVGGRWIEHTVEPADRRGFIMARYKAHDIVATAFQQIKNK